MRILIAGIIVPTFLLVGLLSYGMYRATAKRTAEGILQTARGAVASVDAELKGYTGALRLLASSPSLQSGDLDAFKGEALRLVRELGGTGATIVLADRAGTILLSTSAPAGTPLPRRANLDVVNAVFETGRAHVSDMYMTAVSRKPAFTIDVPVYGDGGVAYDLAFDPSRDAFFKIVDDLRLPEGWVISIFDTKLHHVARAPKLGTNEVTSAAETLRAEMGKAHEGVAATRSLEGVALLTAFARSSESGWSVAIGLPRATLTATLLRSLTLALGAGVVLYVLALAFAYRLAQGITKTEEERALLMHELNHRVKNSLVAVQTIVSQTLRNETDPVKIKRAVQNRIQALSVAHDVLSQSNWSSADLLELLAAVLSVYEDAERPRFRSEGPPVTLPPRVALPLALVMNELGANACKYGALSAPAGSVRITWSQTSSTFSLAWVESGSPPSEKPGNRGFGTVYAERAIEYELGGSIERTFSGDGLRVRIDIPLERGAPQGVVS